jgi:hypothetical protein
MLRRTGYILGLLFVLACALAYPLTWGRYRIVRVHSNDAEGGFTGRIAFVGVNTGQLRAGIQTGGPVPPTGWSVATFDGPVRGKYFFEVAYLSTVSRKILDIRTITFILPVWMPALAASLFMAWRWRRRRTRKATGFPVAEG